MPEKLAINVIKNNWFITLIQENSQYCQYYVIIDATRQMIFDDQTFDTYSKILYNQLVLNPIWYNGEVEYV